MPDETLNGNIMGQADALQRLIHEWPRIAGLPAGLNLPAQPHIVFVGSGTSRFAGEVATQAAMALGLTATCTASLPALQTIERLARGHDVLVVGISQSGNTRTLVDVLSRAHQLGSRTVAVTANASSDLAKAADEVLESYTGPETIFAKTKGFITTAAAASLLALAVARAAGNTSAELEASVAAALEELPDTVAAVAQRSMDIIPQAVARFSSSSGLMVVGSGAQWPAAREGALKILEVAKLLVTSFELEESLHGPFNAVGPETGVVLLAGAIPKLERLTSFVRAVQLVHAPIFIAAEGSVVPYLPNPTTVDLELPETAFPWLSPLLGVVPLQVIASSLARLRDVDPETTRYPNLYEVFATKEAPR